MKTEVIEKRIIAYFEGELSPQEATELRSKLQEKEVLQNLYQEYEEMYAQLGPENWEQASPQMNDRFNDWLMEQQAQQYQSEQPSRKRLRSYPEWIAAAAIGLLLIGSCLGVLLRKNQQQQQEIVVLATEMKNMQQKLAMANLETNSASQRIQAINTLQAEKNSGPDGVIIDALLLRIQNDPNVNVRISASEALLHFPEMRTIEGLIHRLALEEDPRVQLTIIDVLVQLKAQSAIPSLEELMLQDSVAPVVKEQAAKGIEYLM